jgi:hypothetical protein
LRFAAETESQILRLRFAALRMTRCLEVLVGVPGVGEVAGLVL